jgi:hypothetical protein
LSRVVVSGAQAPSLLWRVCECESSAGTRLHVHVYVRTQVLSHAKKQGKEASAVRAASARTTVTLEVKGINVCHCDDPHAHDKEVCFSTRVYWFADRSASWAALGSQLVTQRQCWSPSLSAAVTLIRDVQFAGCSVVDVAAAL